jgi:hypothetical protein
VPAATAIRINSNTPGVTADIRNCTFIGVSVPCDGPHTFTNCTLNGSPI